MNLLIDTQVLVWLVNDDPRLGKQTKQALQDTTNIVAVSYFSLFELTIKASIGKLVWDSSIIDDLPVMGIDLILPDTNILKDYRIFNPNNRDPFDNAIVMVARNERSTLVTSDSRILATALQGLTVINAKE